MPTLISLESMAQYGIPIVIEGISISRVQGGVILNLVDRLMEEAEHPLTTAIELAITAFKNLYEVRGDVWTPIKMLRLGKGHGKPMRNKLYREDDVPRGKLERHESGARNSKRDRQAIKEIVLQAFSQLKNEDAGLILKEVATSLVKKGRRKKK